MAHKYNIGDEFYRVSRKMISMERKKEVKVDENGVEWFRYLNERFDFSIEKVKIVALNYVVFEGPIVQQEDYRNEEYIPQYAFSNGKDFLVAYEDEIELAYDGYNQVFYRDKKQAYECFERWKNR
jgi:hypothetical protein